MTGIGMVREERDSNIVAEFYEFLERGSLPVFTSSDERCASSSPLPIITPTPAPTPTLTSSPTKNLGTKSNAAQSVTFASNLNAISSVASTSSILDILKGLKRKKTENNPVSPMLREEDQDTQSQQFTQTRTLTRLHTHGGYTPSHEHQRSERGDILQERLKRELVEVEWLLQRLEVLWCLGLNHNNYNDDDEQQTQHIGSSIIDVNPTKKHKQQQGPVLLSTQMPHSMASSSGMDKSQTMRKGGYPPTLLSLLKTFVSHCASHGISCNRCTILFERACQRLINNKASSLALNNSVLVLIEDIKRLVLAVSETAPTTISNNNLGIGISYWLLEETEGNQFSKYLNGLTQVALRHLLVPLLCLNPIANTVKAAEPSRMVLHALEALVKLSPSMLTFYLLPNLLHAHPFSYYERCVCNSVLSTLKALCGKDEGRLCGTIQELLRATFVLFKADVTATTASMSLPINSRNYASDALELPPPSQFLFSDTLCDTLGGMVGMMTSPMTDGELVYTMFSVFAHVVTIPSCAKSLKFAKLVLAIVQRENVLVKERAREDAMGVANNMKSFLSKKIKALILKT
eukprot:m.10325 g.10325  ORF g.10325 m.10325 type:complete len:575 (-) comp3652_c0_seq1:77-1801(-)